MLLILWMKFLFTVSNHFSHRALLRPVANVRLTLSLLVWGKFLLVCSCHKQYFFTLLKQLMHL